MQWKNADGSKPAYGYLYDEVNRIAGADYRTRQGSSWAEQAGSHSLDGETQSSREYGYDESGNMTSDSNKGISSTTYDPVLNLPLEVVTKTGTIRSA